MFPVILIICGCLIKANSMFSKHFAKTTPRPIFNSKWTDLDERRLPQWYHQAKIGILVHWGVYSIPAYGPKSARNTKFLSKYWMEGNDEVSSFMRAKYGKHKTYEDLGRTFKASKFDPDGWAELFKSAGARYMILTAKDGDGFSLFPSDFSPGWNAKDIGPKLDIVSLLKRSATRFGLEFGVYYYLFEWIEPTANLSTHLETKVVLSDFNRQIGRYNRNLNPYFYQRIKPELERLVIDYEPKILWADGEESFLSNHWEATDFLAWLYSNSQVGGNVVINDRFENGTRYRHGDFFTYTTFNESVHENTMKQSENFNPRKVKTHKWEHLIPLDKQSLGYRKVQPSVVQFISSRELIESIVITVSCGGNALINIGATSDGRFPKKVKKRLRHLGKWLSVNGDAIYDTTPWRVQNETNGLIWYTCKTEKYNGRFPLYIPFQPDIHAIYAILFQWPADNLLVLHHISTKDGIRNITVLGSNKKVNWHCGHNSTTIFLPDKTNGKVAWTLKLHLRVEEIEEYISDYQ